MKFIADVMLGTLARRLRLLGFDVLYNRNFKDNEIIRLSLEQGRLILTRDTALSERPLAAHHLLIKSENLNEQLDQVLSSFSPEEHPGPLSRCSECNTLLNKIQQEEAKDQVPEYVYKTQKNFLQCPNCKRVYWTGTHVRRMELGRGKK